MSEESDRFRIRKCECRRLASIARLEVDRKSRTNMGNELDADQIDAEETACATRNYDMTKRSP